MGYFMKMGGMAFLVGLVIAVVGAFVNVDWFPVVLVVIGLVVGFLNVSGGESRRFMIASIAFLISSTALYPIDAALGMGGKLDDILHNFTYMIGAAALLVSAMSLFDMSKD